MSDIKQYNEEQYLMLKLAIANMDSGICLFRSYDADDQIKIARELKEDISKECCILDMSRITVEETPDDIIKMRELLKDNLDASVVFLCNLQICGVRLGDKHYIGRLNYMRDQMFAMKKIWVLGMTPYFATLLSQQARDLYSCILNHFEFKQPDEERLWIFEENDFVGDVKLNLQKFKGLRKQIQRQGVENAGIGALLRAVSAWIGICEYCTGETIEWIKKVLDYIGKYIAFNGIEDNRCISYLSLAVAYRKLNLGEEALQIMTKIKERGEKIFSANSREMKEIYKQLGNIYRFLNNYDYAEENIKKAASYDKDKIHDNFYDYLILTDQLAQIKGLRNECQEAIEIYQGLIRQTEKECGSNSIYLSELWNNLGATYARTRQYSEALKCFMKASELMWQANDEGIRKKANIVKNIGYMYAKIGDYDQALNYLQEAENTMKKVDDSLLDLGRQELIYNLMAECYEKKNDFKMGEQYRGKALDVCKNKK